MGFYHDLMGFFVGLWNGISNMIPVTYIVNHDSAQAETRCGSQLGKEGFSHWKEPSTVHYLSCLDAIRTMLHYFSMISCQFPSLIIDSVNCRSHALPLRILSSCHVAADLFIFFVNVCHIPLIFSDLADDFFIFFPHMLNHHTWWGSSRLANMKITLLKPSRT